MPAIVIVAYILGLATGVVIGISIGIVLSIQKYLGLGEHNEK